MMKRTRQEAQLTDNLLDIYESKRINKPIITTGKTPIS